MTMNITFDTIDLNSIFDAVDRVLRSTIPTATTGADNCACDRPSSKSEEFTPLGSASYEGFYCPPINRVIFNGDATIVVFKDGTKSVVVKDANDPYDRTTAIAYAIAKRTLATAVNTKTNAVNAAYINTIHNLVENAYDQQVEEAKAAENERLAQEKHAAQQKALQEKAFKRRVKNRVREMRIDAAAKAELDGSAKILTETSKTRTSSKTPSKKSVYTSGLLQIDPKDAWKCYVRPNKPFSKFSEQEKREYWRAQNGKRRAQGKIA